MFYDGNVVKVIVNLSCVGDIEVKDHNLFSGMNRNLFHIFLSLKKIKMRIGYMKNFLGESMIDEVLKVIGINGNEGFFKGIVIKNKVYLLTENPYCYKDNLFIKIDLNINRAFI